MKKWAKLNLIFLGLILLFIGSLNYFMDPYWTFNHKHKWNDIQKGTNERQQKSNYIYFTNKEYDTLLLGSSRTTYVNPNSFKNLKIFNFSAAGMRPHEYSTYIDFVVNNTSQDIKTIIIAMDFFGYLDYGLFMFNEAGSVVSNTQELFYRWKILFSKDTTETSIKNLRDNLKKRIDDRYNRELIKTRLIRPKSSTLNNQIIEDVEIYTRTEYSGNKNNNFLPIIQKIKEKYKDKKIIIYTTPISEPLFQKLIELKKLDYYYNWLSDLVNTFEVVHHFMYPNYISSNYLDFFADSNHGYSITYDYMAKTIQNNYNDKYHDFGMKIDKLNKKEKFLLLEEIIEKGR